ncbi:Tn3 family transposase [Phyllobacterium chamaecytisi]|uniref:Tn3 family transposase n=1 Tax=Phyllobacterium chamaecytisi TaxID=2876082 RepID=UPI004025C46B
MSDRYGAFYIIAMNANASETIYVFDGLLYHGSNLAIETHPVDRAGLRHELHSLHLVGFLKDWSSARSGPKIRYE